MLGCGCWGEGDGWRDEVELRGLCYAFNGCNSMPSQCRRASFLFIILFLRVIHMQRMAIVIHNKHSLAMRSYCCCNFVRFLFLSFFYCCIPNDTFAFALPLFHLHTHSWLGGRGVNGQVKVIESSLAPCSGLGANSQCHCLLVASNLQMKTLQYAYIVCCTNYLLKLKYVHTHTHAQLRRHAQVYAARYDCEWLVDDKE